jgi:SOS-response transcriptional repressor LexA
MSEILQQPLTKKQKELYDFITIFVLENQYSPTYQELADLLGVSIGAIQVQIKELLYKGWITKGKGKQRNILPANLKIVKI